MSKLKTVLNKMAIQMNGVINVYKEAGCSSFDVVHKVKKILNIKRCGHIGTLDPIAEGVLPVCINNATKLSQYLMADDKEYIVSVRLGIQTDTMDITGEILERSDFIPKFDDIKKMASLMVGENIYKIPAFSAVKIKGERAYNLARRGVIQDAGKKKMKIYQFEILKYEYPALLIKILCEKGTYIRSVVDEFGEKLGCFGTMEHLIRTRNGVFDIKSAYKISQIVEMRDKGDFSFIKEISEVINWPKCVLKDDFVDKFLNGVAISKFGYITLPIEEESEYFWIFDRQKSLLGFARKNKGGDIPLRTVKVFR